MARAAGESDPVLGIRKLKACYQQGKLIELGDRSTWRVPPGHEVLTRLWRTRTRITVVPGGFSGYPYDLINHMSGDKVPARRTEVQLWDSGADWSDEDYDADETDDA